MAKDASSNWRSPPRPREKSLEQVRPITGNTGKRKDGERVADGPVSRAEQCVVREGSSPSGAQMRGAISKSGGKPRWPKKAEGMETSKRARKRKLDHSQGGPGATACCASEGRVSIVRWNPKGMRRSTGPQSMGKPNDEPVSQWWARSSLSYGGEGVLIHPPTPRCLRAARYGRTTRDLWRPGRVSGWHRNKRTYK
jgi:hypothetical protein